MLEIRQRLLPDGRQNKPNKLMEQPQWLTIHNTDNLQGTAESHARYILNGSGGRQASWHYTVDDKGIYQHLRDNEQGWHAGDSNGPGNRTSIGIEVCMYLKMNTEQCWRNTAWLVAKLLDKYKLDISRVVPHKKWSGKQCPSQLLPYWDRFLQMVRDELRKLQQPNAEALVVMNGKTICVGSFMNSLVTVPVRKLAEVLGAKVSYNGTYAIVNGRPIIGSRLVRDVTYAPVREVVEACGAKVTGWNGKERKVSIQKS
ncbi:N-acetylmuramoyl-L-alanine amidase [Paenibacillus alvei]|uniref:N-acetylmuramoyl-L-alanine amidase n=1 Tax=Paenibacillus alvei TaxID=44250 RepID=UPI0002888A91|nr:N-acetylmuramoyl-L-alanine amidase [Paenibacillus alvei]EJW20010.1 N-acetylmuramoyl-L-alanine amidase CwlH [Paenibacillus alvei DSM 29]MCY9543403.1 N-acetylmuramoyl-L-alanine amidase [Paenibacillus alvei]MCY9704717.1 N-acetylmuramoyl-L-alanine amidase [Paenibacillus alvei]MCY9733730.1 N-acetylmuramoyl-L-alanine amidase [Paenibacillus alvei]MCY9755479.1 N-acetylmuramoyl-L-alanine amidase [Paenibacillus alvei]